MFDHHEDDCDSIPTLSIPKLHTRIDCELYFCYYNF